MTLRLRVLAGLVLIAALMVIGAFTVTRTTRASLVERLDAQLESAASMMTNADVARRGDARNQPVDNGWRRLTTFYVGYLGPDGALETVFAPDLTDGADTPPRIDLSVARAAAAGNEEFTTGSSDAGSYRVRVVPSGSNGLVVIALPTDSVDRAMSRLIGLELGITVIGGVVLVLVAWWVVHLGIRPLKSMTTVATGIAAGDLSARVPEADPTTEAGELGAALNTMLGRIEVAFDERERSQQRLHRFVADASHELRTPVATIRGYAELFRQGGLERRDDLVDAMRRTEQEAIRMGALVDDLLLLAKLDESRPLASAPVDLAMLVRDAASDAHALDPTRHVRPDAPEPIVCAGDSDRLRQVLANLTRNAIVHTPHDTPIELTARGAGDRVVVQVIDHGPGIAPETADRVFERFARVDASRSRDRGGSGLGLAIVRAIVAAHGGEVWISTTPGGGATVTVTLPVGSSRPRAT